jgi:hypothetical protein
MNSLAENGVRELVPTVLSTVTFLFNAIRNILQIPKTPRQARTLDLSTKLRKPRQPISNKCHEIVPCDGVK